MSFIEQYLLQLNTEKRRWRRAVAALTALSLIVALVTTWNLRMTGVTIANSAGCGIEEHSHTEQCVSGTTLICGKKEHIHTTDCYSDPAADTEMLLDWQNFFSNYPYTGQLEKDLVDIAKSQVGYTESEKNFQVDNAGIRHGYTRYGAWYGAPYNEWSALFVSFCLHFAGADETYPLSSGAIWAEFNSFKVTVGGVELKRGYYLSQGGVNTDNWEFFGDWSDIPEADRDRNDAQWYLVHLDYDKFRITIPWLEGHTITDVTNAAGETTAYSVNFPENAASKFDSPVTVEVEYKAVIEANAAIGNTTHGNRFNKAHASWTSEHETLTTPPDEVVTYVYGIGLLKDDINTRENLAGAKFRVFKDEACTEPVYVIPTNVKGVYIIDSLNTVAEEISGIKQETSRKKYEAYLEEYLKDKDGNLIEQDNLVISQENGKLAILGLKEGTYYLKEVEAPAGYNALTQPVEFKAGEDIRSFIIFADENGNVANIQQTDGVHHEIDYDLTHTVVHNSKGVVLPSTGGMGTFWLITIGTILAIGFAVFLITHKKMSAYTD